MSKTYGNSLVLEIGKNPIIFDLERIRKSIKKGNLVILSNIGDQALTTRGKLKIPADIPVVTRIRHLWKSDFALEFQSRFFLGRLPEYVLYDTTDDPAEFPEEISQIVSKTKGWGIDLGRDGDLGRVEKFRKYMGEEPEFIYTPLNPTKYKKEILDYCEAKNIRLIAYDIYGSNVFREWMIETFTTDYLERFAASKSSGIVLNTDSGIYGPIFTLVSYLEEHGFGGEEVRDPDLFTLGKDSWREPLKEPKRSIHSISGGGIPGGSRFIWYSPWNSGGRVNLSFKALKTPVLSDEHKELSNELEDYKIPEYITGEEARKYSDMFGISYLATENPGHKIIYNIQGDITTVLLKPKFWFGKKKLYAVVYNGETRNPILIKLG